MLSRLLGGLANATASVWDEASKDGDDSISVPAAGQELSSETLSSASDSDSDSDSDSESVCKEVDVARPRVDDPVSANGSSSTPTQTNNDVRSRNNPRCGACKQFGHKRNSNVCPLNQRSHTIRHQEALERACRQRVEAMAAVSRSDP